MSPRRKLLKARKSTERDDYFVRGGYGKQKQNMLRNAKCGVTSQTHLYPKHRSFINTNSNASRSKSAYKNAHA